MIDRFQAQMQALQMLSKAQEATSDNLANINTPGFKGSKLFHRLLTEQVNGEDVTRTVTMQQINFEQGVLEPTGNTLDFGIDGEGFFVVQQDGERVLTRDGRFQFDSDGYLRNGQGAQVMGNGGPIHLPEYFISPGNPNQENQLEVAKDGTIRLNDEIAGQLRIVKVEDPSLLSRKGSTYFSVESEEALQNDTESIVMQGYYEKGNVDSLHEMVDMMRNMRVFEAQQRVMRTTDEMLSQATNKLGRF
jgi:flagellar basal-body rod protein FlgF